jgi:DUF4097 and DUF4098 domain-containing protein YvlB
MKKQPAALVASAILFAALPALAQPDPPRPPRPPRERTEQRDRGRESDRHRQEATDRQVHTLDIGRAGELDLGNVSGDITVTAGGGSEATVEMILRGYGGTPDEAKRQLTLLRVDVTRRASRAEVRAVYKEGERNYRVSAEYRVTAPVETRVRAHSVSGDVRVSKMKGELSVETVSGEVVVDSATRVTAAKSVSGDVQLTGISTEGILAASSVSGDVLARGLKARRLELSTVSGGLQIREVACDRAEIQSVSGDVEFAGSLARGGRYEVQSHSGNIRIALSGGAGFEVEAHSFSGEVRADVQLTRQAVDDDSFGRRRRRLNRTLRGTYGDGSAFLELTTFSGDIIISPQGK